MNTGETFIANLQTTETVKPSEGSLDDPTMLAEAFLGFDTTTRDPRNDVSLPAGNPALREVIPFVGVDFLRPTSREAALSAKRRYRVQQGFEHLGVMGVARRNHGGKRDSVRVYDDVMRLLAVSRG